MPPEGESEDARNDRCTMGNCRADSPFMVSLSVDRAFDRHCAHDKGTGWVLGKICARARQRNWLGTWGKFEVKKMTSLFLCRERTTKELAVYFEKFARTHDKGTGWLLGKICAHARQRNWLATWKNLHGRTTKELAGYFGLCLIFEVDCDSGQNL